MSLEQTLQTYGLSQKQTRVYLACLELGSAPVQKIAHKAGLSRSTVYEVLEHLTEQKFINTYRKKTIHYFSAEDPAQIVRVAQNKVDWLKDSLPELKALAGQSRRRPTVRFYEGKEQMKIVLEEILAEADDLWSFAAPEDLFRVMGDYFDKFVERRINKKIPVRMLAVDSPKTQERKILGASHLRTVKILPPGIEYHSNKWLWKNKIALFSFVNDLVAVVIESKELCTLERAMFQYLWDKLPNV